MWLSLGHLTAFFCLVFFVLSCGIEEPDTSSSPQAHFKPNEITFLLAPDGKRYSTTCLRQLSDWEPEQARDRLPYCEAGATSSRFALQQGGGWTYNPYEFWYSTNWCRHYLGWSWSSYYFWPQYPTPPTQPNPVYCNNSCLCGISYESEYCPAVSCTIEELRACGVYR